MAKGNTYKCSDCGAQYPRWIGKCVKCGNFGTVEEIVATHGKPVGVKGDMLSSTVIRPARRVKDISYSKHQHTSTGIGELDRVLGGGLVSGQVVLLAGEPGVGKALSLDTLLPTPTGWITIGETQVGDIILGGSGTPTKIIAISEVYNNLDCYKLTFENKEEIVASGEHLWLTTNRTENPKKDAIVSTTEIYNNVMDPTGICNYSVVSTPRIDFSEQSVKFNRKKKISPAKNREWGQGYSSGYELIRKDQLNNNSNGDEAYSHINETDNTLTTINDENLFLTRNSVEFREGFIEGVGEANEDYWNIKKKENIMLSFFSQHNAKLVYEILNSIGHKPYMSKETWHTQLEGVNPNNFIYTIRATPKQRFSPLRIVNVEKILSVPVKCLQVEAEDGLYLVGKSYIATHNSTMLLAAAHKYGESGHTVLYISGEESAEQISLRARRIGANSDNLLIADETDLSVILGQIEQVAPDLVIVDSVQTVASPDVDGRAGGMAQVQEVATVLTRVAKSSHLSLTLVGQITKANDLAGPKTLEHLVDTVLFFEGDRNSGLRLLRTMKNRFGPADEIACFEQTENGMEEVSDPSGLFLTEREVSVPGTATTVVLEGRRPLLAEIQALVSPTNAPNPRRGVSGLDFPRTAMLIAVTERYGRLKLYDKDTFLATVAGMKINEPAADLAICLALASATKESTIPNSIVTIGEVALSGEIRRVQNIRQRLVEALRLGYTKALVPRGTASVDGILNLPVGHIKEALEILKS